jgi:UDP-N-acetylmuramoyl-tripeptide--D-alanyl-D-alanine ligase
MKAQTEKHKGAVSAVLGDMLELGDASDRLHREVGEAAAACGIRKLYAFGKFAQRIAEGAKSGGIPEECVFINDSEDIEATAEQIRHSYDGELLIVKASHAVHAERIYIFLKD